VRREDFPRSPSEHLQSVESAVYDAAGAAVFAMHEHAAAELMGLVSMDDAGAAARDPAMLMSKSRVTTADWIFLAALPYEVALAPLARLRDTAIVASGALVLVIVLTGVFSARSVTTPLHELAEAARQFGREGRHDPIATPARDEVGTLVRAFNHMAADLERSRAEIDRLHSRDLERAQQLATVGELASGVAHEIRNPLMGVAGALDDPLRPRQQTIAPSGRGPTPFRAIESATTRPCDTRARPSCAKSRWTPTCWPIGPFTSQAPAASVGVRPTSERVPVAWRWGGPEPMVRCWST
jgi:HAMP domain-containing protein